MFVLTVDQRSSRTGKDRVPELLAALAHIPARLAFERTVGDEIQGLLESPAAVVEAALCALRSGHWHVGIGIGEVNLPLPARSHEAAGGAFIAAREAVERAKKSGERVPLCVRAETASETETAAAAEAVLVLIGDLVRKRSASEWRVVDALVASPAPRQIDVARDLGISPQAVSKAVLRAGWVEEQNGALAAQLLLSRCGQRQCQGLPLS